MAIIFWLALGGLLGFTGRWLMPGPDLFGRVGSILITALGAALGGFIGALYFNELVTDVAAGSMLTATIGAFWTLLAHRSYALRGQIERP